MTELTAIVITKDEGLNLRQCLGSLSGLATEIVVVDSGSSDDTLSIAKEFGAIISQSSDWLGFGVQKNRALALATKDWVLSIDADERLSQELREEIKEILKSPSADCYLIPRRSWYCGRFIRHSGWRPDYVARLFKRGVGSFSSDLVHEKLEFSCFPRKLKSDLIHMSFKDFSEVLTKVDMYSTYSAEQLYDSGVRGNIFKAVLHGSWAFFRSYVLRHGFLDGAQGFALAVSNAEGSYYRYVKLWLLGVEREKHDH
jgi:glycosyltransferase involved in cell wall biosynthesis